MTTPQKWFSRVPLIFATLIFLLIGSKYVMNPSGAATGSGLSITAPVGTTNMRAGVGGFALGAALITAGCLIFGENLRNGLYFVVAILSPVLVVRVAGALVDGSLEASARIVAAETTLLILSLLGLHFSRHRDGVRRG
jgi:hypothetical protein